MIYCVVPLELADELYDKLADHYAADPEVEVIIDRRRAERRRSEPSAGAGEQRSLRDRRRGRVAGEFPPTTGG